ncbi:secreted RxLR effector protein 161-like [Lycium ferocissimum]|uniref:secreted RxLR effector protein 161-like n=1 Tax=Lycium ferocissimum TaxID=112874 RepID=UPI0028157135|nr:secreted RxLR effector protein 161-like [Lycium ferocissimum]
MGEASYVIGIEIFRDRSQGLLGLSQKGYIERVLERFNMNNCSSGIVPIQKGDKFSLFCGRNALGRYRSNSRIDHWKAAKKVLRYLKGTKDYMLTYRRSNSLEVIGYSDSDHGGCVDTRKSTFGYLFLLPEGAISWKSAKKSVIATSTMEAKFVASFEATIHAL